MVTEIKHDTDRNIVNPQKFVVWLLIVSVIMLFAALTSAYLVRRGTGDDWIPHDLPSMFTYSTVIAFLSSVTIQFGVIAHKKGDFKKTNLWVVATLILGVVFCVMQIMGGYEWLQVEKIYFTGPGSTPRAQFVYLLALTHLGHILLALLFVIVLCIKSFTNIDKPSFATWISNSAVFWHFLGLLWLYLFIFLNIIP